MDADLNFISDGLWILGVGCVLHNRSTPHGNLSHLAHSFRGWRCHPPNPDNYRPHCRYRHYAIHLHLPTSAPTWLRRHH